MRDAEKSISASQLQRHIGVTYQTKRAERDGRIHLQSMANRRFESIKPVLDAKLADDTKEIVTDGNPTLDGQPVTVSQPKPWLGRCGPAHAPV